MTPPVAAHRVFAEEHELIRLARGSRLVEYAPSATPDRCGRFTFYGRFLVLPNDPAKQSAGMRPSAERRGGEPMIGSGPVPATVWRSQLSCDLVLPGDEVDEPQVHWESIPFHPNLAEQNPTPLSALGLQPSLVKPSSDAASKPSAWLLPLCAERLWDVLRFAYIDRANPVNARAAAWVEAQPAGTFPLLEQPLRERCVPRPINLISYQRRARQTASGESPKDSRRTAEARPQRAMRSPPIDDQRIGETASADDMDFRHSRSAEPAGAEPVLFIGPTAEGEEPVDAVEVEGAESVHASEAGQGQAAGSASDLRPLDSQQAVSSAAGEDEIPTDADAAEADSAEADSAGGDSTGTDSTGADSTSANEIVFLTKREASSEDRECSG